VKLLEYGTTTRDEPFLVMEYLEGTGLHSLILGKSPLLDGQRVNLLRQMAEALGRPCMMPANLHRDICPPNYVVTPDAGDPRQIGPSDPQ